MRTEEAGSNATKFSDILSSLEVDLVGSARLDGRSAGIELEKARILLPGANSVVVMAMEIPVEIFRHLTYRQEMGNIELRDMYHQTEQLISGRLNWEAYRLVKKLHGMGYQALALPAGSPYDARFLEGAFSYKHAAQLAGLGYIGRHSLLVTTEFGPRVKIAAVLTDAKLKRAAATKKESLCIRCGACMRACPAKAISQPVPGEPYRINTHACNSFLTAVGLCAECMKVCPSSQVKRGVK
jgi:epoxyqueuosine reductase QueG